MLNINRTAENGKAVFALEGRLDTISAPELEKSLKEVLDGLSELTLDFGKLDYISSAGLRVLLTTYKALLGRGEMKILHVNETVKEIFEVTGFTEILTIE